MVLMAEVPRKAPEFTIQMPGGEETNLSSYLGKVVALEFLLTTCEHCQRCSQVLNRMHREFGSQGFQPVGVAVNDNGLFLAGDYVRQFNLGFPVGFSARDKLIGFLQHPIMTPLSFPTLLIIDREGIIRHQYNGRDPFFDNEEKNLREAILPLLKSKARSAAKRAAR
jgi:peroxiredoxin